MFSRQVLPALMLHDQNTFDKAFLRDISHARKQLIIESPFITSKRVHSLLPVLKKLRRRGVQVIINTRDPEEHDPVYNHQASEAISSFQALGIIVLYTAGHHRKLAIVDSEIIWLGSLNILSFNDSCEIMQRITSNDEARRLLAFIKLNKFIRVS